MTIVGAGAKASSEVRPLLRLAIPLITGELAWMAMGIVDSMMTGRINAAAMGAVYTASILFFTVTVFGMGLLLGMDTLVSQAWGARDEADTRRTLRHGLYLAAALTPVFMGAQWATIPFLRWFGVNAETLEYGVPYLEVVTLSTPGLLVYSAYRRYLQGIERTRPILFALVSSNLINVGANWALIFGHLGFPAMGTEGAAWATVLSRTYLAALLAWSAGPVRAPWTIEWPRMRRLLALGGPAALQIVFEVGVFSLATALIARLEPLWSAAHTIAISACSVSYMVPLGLSSASSVRVGNCIGAREFAAAARAGWTAIGMGVAFMGLAGVTFVAFPGAIARVFSEDPAVAAAAAPLLMWVAVFQLFDGAQGVAVGALRGAGETKLAAAAHFVCYWVAGLPLGAWLCFRAGYGAVGLWAGLSIAVVLIGLLLTAIWARKARAIRVAGYGEQD